MYNSYYNLTLKPFKIDTDPRFMWFGEKHREALANLTYGLLDRNGFIVLTGDVGTGKTTLINALLDTMDDHVRVVKISHPSLEINEFLTLVAKTLDPTVTLSDKSDVLLFFNSYLQSAHADGDVVLLIVDEAHRLSMELLEEIRLLSNIEAAGETLLSIMLVGQDEIKPTLMAPACRALQQRITSIYEIEALSKPETRQYVNHRLQVAGHQGPLFTTGAFDAVYAISKGNPRVINVLCDRALLTGYVKENLSINSTIITECARELGMGPEGASGRQKGPIKKSPAYGRAIGSKLATGVASAKEMLAVRFNNVTYRCRAWAAVARTAPRAIARFIGKIASRFNQTSRQMSLPALFSIMVVFMFVSGSMSWIANSTDVDISAKGTMSLSGADSQAMHPTRQGAPKGSVVAESSYGDPFWDMPADLFAVDIFHGSTPSGWVPTGDSGFDASREVNPILKQTPMELAAIALTQGNHLKAIELLEAYPAGTAEEKASVDEMHAKALVGRAEAIMATSPSEAEVLLLKAVDVVPDQVDAFSMLGKRYTQIKGYDQAINAYLHVVRIDPSAADALFNLGFLYATIGRFAAAENALEQVVGLKPHFLDKTLFNLAVVQQSRGKIGASISNLEKVVHMAPENEKALAYLNELKRTSATGNGES